MKLDYFTPEEFRECWAQMHPTTLKCVDAFRHAWGAPCTVSPHKDALGRNLGKGKLSGHNVDEWEWVYAVDLFPKGMHTEQDLARAYRCARKANATGIGLYTDTRPSFMIHLDTRPDRTPDNPRLWCRDAGQYKAIETVMPKGWER
ncbi:MAG: hypothetical protein MJH10_10485 [Epibacterium sp.]|nr:hypothetical protein [Epibacterium sp.]NQX73967.1 hypothetical protein [Epibacterium sp.]